MVPARGTRFLVLQVILIQREMGSPGCLTSLNTPWFCSQIRQVHICFPAVDDGVGVFAGSFSSSSVCHGHLEPSTALFVATALCKHSSNRHSAEFIYCSILTGELNSLRAASPARRAGKGCRDSAEPCFPAGPVPAVFPCPSTSSPCLF